MPGWIIAAALGSVALTALLTFVLWRLNAPLREHGALSRSARADAEGAPLGDGTGEAGSGGEGE